jgi:hypothetical protein
MALLIEFLDGCSAHLLGKREALKKLETQYRKIYDPDIVREMKVLRSEIAKKHSEIKNELLYNLDEFRAIHRYFPELMSAFMEDESIGKVLRGKAWLLDFKSAPPKVAAAKLQQLRAWRLQLRGAKRALRGWVGIIRSKSFVATYPVLKAHLTGDMDKKDVLLAIEALDKDLRKEGWLVLISDSLIQIPLTKFMNKVSGLKYDEAMAKAEFMRMRGRGTIPETKALRSLQEIAANRQHYEAIVTQILLSNPAYLSSLKKKKGWLSKDRPNALERFAEKITPHKIKERAWLNDMKKRLAGMR